MSDKEYFSHLYEIASHLNREYSLHSALRKSLEKTAELLHLETGWIWLVEGEPRSVYLAASYNLPPALSNYPERLSGWCFCLEKYFSNTIDQALNISEITCTRLKNITSGTRDLKYHATIPIITEGKKVGLINLVSKESQRLNEKQLSILNTVAELMGIAVQRTRMQGNDKSVKNDAPMYEVLERILEPRIDELITGLQALQLQMKDPAANTTEKSIAVVIRQAEEMRQQLSLITGESAQRSATAQSENKVSYPHSTISNRELEVLEWVKKGLTNKDIGEKLFITERTVKFHISSILHKLPATTRTEAVNIAIQKGIL